MTGWTDKIWARRYQAIVISNEEEAQTARFEYLLANGGRKVLDELQVGGGLTVDVEPEMLPYQVVNRYLEVKRSGRL